MTKTKESPGESWGFLSFVRDKYNTFSIFLQTMKKFTQFIRESREEAAKSAAAHHASAAEHKAEASKHEEGSDSYHQAMAQHHKSLMHAYRAEAKSKWRHTERNSLIVKADHHFTQAMKHHTHDHRN